MSAVSEFEYVIIGAGSAGCVLANRLGEDPDVRVLVIEAGGSDYDPLIRIPLAWARMLQQRKYDWGYFTEPEPYTSNRVIECARGKVIGGCSSTNAMVYVRGHANDYERWSRRRLPGWDYEHVLPYFKKSETWEKCVNEYRGDSGPMNVNEATFMDPVIDAYLDIVSGMGFPMNEDYNGAQQEGFGPTQQTTRNGRRESAATAYLRPALMRGNVTLKTRAMATRILFDGGRAVGVLYQKNGRTYEARATGEVLLSGGVINSPHLLMLSGIGPADELQKHGIKTRVDLVGVGKNLQDHMTAGVLYNRTTKGPFLKQMRLDRLAIEIPMAYFFGKGSATQYPLGPMGFLSLDSKQDVPSIQLLFGAGPLHAYPWIPLLRPHFPDAFGCRAVLLHPKSRGVLELASADPHQPMRIRQNFFSDERDLKALTESLKLAREILNKPQLSRFRGKELAPGETVTDDPGMDNHIKNTCITIHHPLGTCCMGDGETAVVDGELKVKGIEGLRVVDASVMPDMVSGNINAAVLMIAERAADLIKGMETLPPLRP